MLSSTAAARHLTLSAGAWSSLLLTDAFSLPQQVLGLACATLMMNSFYGNDAHNALDEPAVRM
jgi:hypothetical protein